MEINFDKLKEDIVRLKEELNEAVDRLEINLLVNQATHPYKGIMLGAPYYLYSTKDGLLLFNQPVSDFQLIGIFYLDTDRAWRRRA